MRVLHVVAIAVMPQQQPSLAAALSAIRMVYMQVMGKPLAVCYVMADADKAQQKSVDKVFGVDCNIVHLMGLFHVAKQVYEKARGLDANVFAMIHRGVHGLHFTVNSSEYEKKMSSVLLE